MSSENTNNDQSNNEFEQQLDPKFVNIFVGGLGRKFNEIEVLAYFKTICHVEKYEVKMRGEQRDENFPVGYMILTTLKTDCPKLLRNPYHNVGKKN